MARERNGTVWKVLLVAGGLILTVAVTLIASGGSWGRQKEKIAQIENKNVEQDSCIKELRTEDGKLKDGQQQTREDIVEIKADLRYIREAVDELRRK